MSFLFYSSIFSSFGVSTANSLKAEVNCCFFAVCDYYLLFDRPGVAEFNRPVIRFSGEDVPRIEGLFDSTIRACGRITASL